MSYNRHNANPQASAASRPCHWQDALSVFLVIAIGLYLTFTSRVYAQVRVTAIATALNHISVIELAPGETVARVATGATPSQMEVQWTGPFVLVKPLQPGLSTNLVVFSSKGGVYSYEVLPAGKPADMTMLVRQYDQGALTRGQAIAAALEREHLSENARDTELLLHTRVIDTKAVEGQKTGVAVLVRMVTVGARNDYVRFTVVNHGSHSYRVMPPAIVKIKPVSAAGFAIAHRDTQLTPAKFATLVGSIESRVTLVATTLKKAELLPNSTVDFTVAFPKPKAAPGVFEFSFAKNYGGEVTAYAVF